MSKENKVMFLEVTSKCNLRCEHCFHEKRIHEDFKYWDRARNLISKIDIQEIKFFGGEPLLGNLEEMNKTMGLLPNYKYRITSNLTLRLSKEQLNFLNRLYLVQTSFDLGVRFENYKQVIRWYKNLQKIRTPKIINIVVTEKILKIDPTRLYNTLMRIKGVKEIYLFQLEQDQYNKHLIPKDEELAQKWTAEITKLINPKSFYAKSKQAICPGNYLSIKANGEICKCVKFGAKFLKIGHIKDIDYLDIDKAIYKDCPINVMCLTCEYFKECEKCCYKETICIKKRAVKNYINAVNTKK